MVATVVAKAAEGRVVGREAAEMEAGEVAALEVEARAVAMAAAKAAAVRAAVSGVGTVRVATEVVEPAEAMAEEAMVACRHAIHSPRSRCHRHIRRLPNLARHPRTRRCARWRSRWSRCT